MATYFRHEYVEEYEWTKTRNRGLLSRVGYPLFCNPDTAISTWVIQIRWACASIVIRNDLLDDADIVPTAETLEYGVALEHQPDDDGEDKDGADESEEDEREVIADDNAH